MLPGQPVRDEHSAAQKGRGRRTMMSWRAWTTFFLQKYDGCLDQTNTHVIEIPENSHLDAMVDKKPTVNVPDEDFDDLDGGFPAESRS